MTKKVIQGKPVQGIQSKKISQKEVFLKKDKPTDELSFWQDRQLWLPILCVLIVTAIVFIPSLNNAFVNWDDDDNLVKNPNLKAFDWNSIRAMFTTHVIGNYNPLPIFSFALEKKLFGMYDNPLKPSIFHIDNLLLHLVCVFFSYRILLELKLSRWAAVLAALLFGLHPMRVESVAWVTERKDVLFGAFYLPATYLYFRWLDAVGSKKTQIYLLITVLFTLALFAKIQAVVLPLSMLAIDYYRRRPLKLNLIIEKIPFFALSLAVGLLGIYFLQSAKSLDDPTHFSFLQRLFIGCYSYFTYLAKFIFPYKMSPLYPYTSIIQPEVYLSALLLLPFGFWLYYAWRKDDRKTLFGVLFFTLNVMFLLQIVGAGQGYLADRFTYIPYLGLFFLVGTVYDYFVKNRPSNVGILHGGLGLYLVILAVTTWNQTGIWKNGGTLWTHVLKYYPDDTPLAWGNLGLYYRDNKEYEKALPNLNKAISLKPTSALHNSRGKLFFDTGRSAQAIEEYTAALRLGDKESNVVKGEIYINRGAAQASGGNLQAALADLSAGLVSDPKNANGYLNRSLLYFQTQQYEKAVQDQTNYLALNPYYYEMYYERAITKAALNQHSTALPDFDVAIQHAKANGLFYAQRARTHLALGNKSAAQQDIRQAQQLGQVIDPALVQAVQ